MPTENNDKLLHSQIQKRVMDEKITNCLRTLQNPELCPICALKFFPENITLKK